MDVGFPRFFSSTFLQGDSAMKQSAFLKIVSILLGAFLWLPPLEAGAAPGTVTRHEETDPAIVYSPGNWISDSVYGPWSGGSAMYTVAMGAQATFTFTGTGVSWIGYRGRYGGIVLVFVDGSLAAALDTYSATEQISVPVYTASGLAPGTHSLKLQLTGARNLFAVNSETVVDAFDVTN